MTEELHEQLMKLFTQLMKNKTKDFNGFRNLEDVQEIDLRLKAYNQLKENIDNLNVRLFELWNHYHSSLKD